MRGASLFGAWAEKLHKATGIDPEYRVNGMLVLPPFDIQRAQNWCASHAAPCESKGGGILLSNVAQVRNPRLLQAQRVRVEQLGGRIVEQCEVKNIVADGRGVKHLETTHGEFMAGRYIVTAGAWSKNLLAEFALGLDIKPIRGQMLLFKFDEPPLQHIVLQKDLYLIPRCDGHLLVGSTLEDVGFDKTTTTQAREMLLQRAVVLLPELRDVAVTKQWSGLRPASTGNIPTIGRHPRLVNLFINSGHFRYGVTMAPASTELLINEIEDIEQHSRIAPYRWGLRGSGRDLV